MRIYRALIKPQICYPDQRYNAVCRDLEEDGKWYSEEEKEAFKEKCKHLENTFEQVVFDVKYEPIDAIPVDWIFEQMQILHELHNKNEYVLQWLLELWQKEQEAQDG